MTFGCRERYKIPVSDPVYNTLMAHLLAEWTIDIIL